MSAQPGGSVSLKTTLLSSPLSVFRSLTVRHREVDGVTDGRSPCLTSIHPWCLHLNALLVGRQEDMAQIPESANGPELEQKRVVSITAQSYSLALEDCSPRWV